MKLKQFVAGVVALLLAGCASYAGRGLVPGQSTARDVEALMGVPADRRTVANGDTVLYYPRGPEGVHTYAARISPGGVLKSIEQLLTVENLKMLVPDVTTADQVREHFGPPRRFSRLERQRRDVWEYYMYGWEPEPHFLYVQLSDDGIVREVLLLKDYKNEPGHSKD